MAENWLEALRESDFGKAMRAKCVEAEDVPGERSGDGWNGFIYGFCPVQGHGQVGDVFWYFRARHEEWRFEVYATPCDDELPADEALLWDRFETYTGNADNAGWMKFSEAWAIIERQIALYRSSLVRGEPREGK